MEILSFQYYQNWVVKVDYSIGTRQGETSS